MRRVLVIGARRPTLPARVHSAGAVRRGWLGCAPDLAGPGGSLLGPQAVPASGEQPPTQWICTSGSGKAVVVTRGPYRRTKSGSTRPVLQRGARREPLATRSLAGRPPDQWSPRPSGVHSTRFPPGLSAAAAGSLGCSAYPTAVVVALPGQLPRHGKPGVGLGELQLSAPQVLLDVDVGPVRLSVDLLVERLTAAERLVTAPHGVFPGQLPPLRHRAPLPSQGPPGPSRLERQLPIEYVRQGPQVHLPAQARRRPSVHRRPATGAAGRAASTAGRSTATATCRTWSTAPGRWRRSWTGCGGPRGRVSAAVRGNGCGRDVGGWRAPPRGAARLAPRRPHSSR